MEEKVRAIEERQRLQHTEAFAIDRLRGLLIQLVTSWDEEQYILRLRHPGFPLAPREQEGLYCNKSVYAYASL